MAHQPSLTDRRASPVRVWAYLAAEHRTQVIQLMAKLAFKLVLAQSSSPIQEAHRAIATE